MATDTLTRPQGAKGRGGRGLAPKGETPRGSVKNDLRTHNRRVLVTDNSAGIGVIRSVTGGATRMPVGCGHG